MPTFEEMVRKYAGMEESETNQENDMQNEQPKTTGMMAHPNDPTLIKMHLTDCLKRINGPEGRPSSRYMAIAATKLEEVIHRIDDHIIHS